MITSCMFDFYVSFLREDYDTANINILMKTERNFPHFKRCNIDLHAGIIIKFYMESGKKDLEYLDIVSANIIVYW